ncbi:MAG: hypothetical protein IIA65_03835 [Planctomycetes bacterium]|nr:hypothetical protein [Planctomycetota bacterium]
MNTKHCPNDIALLTLFLTTILITPAIAVINQFGVEIPGSMITVDSQTVNTGDRLSLSEGIQSFSGAPGVVGQVTSLGRTETREVLKTTTGFAFERITSAVLIRLHDQWDVEIPGSKINTRAPLLQIVTGDTVVFPITDEDVYPTMFPSLKDGHLLQLYPAYGNALPDQKPQ